jgi:hypothetical protein
MTSPGTDYRYWSGRPLPGAVGRLRESAISSGKPVAPDPSSPPFSSRSLPQPGDRDIANGVWFD